MPVNLGHRRRWLWPAVAGAVLALLLPASAHANPDGYWHDGETPVGCSEAAITSYVDGVLSGWVRPCTTVPPGAAFGIQFHRGGRYYLTPTLIWYPTPGVVTPWSIHQADLDPAEGTRLVLCPAMDETRKTGGPVYGCLSLYNTGTGLDITPFYKKDSSLGTVCICLPPEPPNCGTCL